MRNRFTLYINGIRADIGEQTPILFTYTLEELQNPTIKKNSYSKQITLAGTPANNRIFQNYFRPEAVANNTTFNPAKRMPFVIVSDGGVINESGYVRLDGVDRTGQEVKYKLTLFGGLGDFLYNLQYDSAGNARDLGSLKFFQTVEWEGEDIEEEINVRFYINRNTVLAAWYSINGGPTGPYHDPMWDIVNFAPCYNGIPDNFDAKHALVKAEDAGLETAVTDEDGFEYGTREGFARVELPAEMNEWEVKDMRSYHQRPVVAVKALLDAITNQANNGGYEVNFLGDFFDSEWVQKTWMTLLPFPKLPLRETGSVSTGTVTLNLMNETQPGELISYIDTPSVKERSYESYDIQPGAFAINQMESDDIDFYLERILNPAGSTKILYVNCIIVEIIQKDVNGNVIGASPVMAFGPEPVPTRGLIWDTKTLCEAVGYTPIVADPNNYGQYVPGHFHSRSGSYTVADWTGSAMHVELNSGHNVYRREVHITKKAVVLTLNEDWEITDRQDGTWGTLWYLDGGGQVDVAVVSATASSLERNISYSDTGAVRSGSFITKEMLFSGTMSPAEFLLSFCKRHRLFLSVDASKKKVYIESHRRFYRDFGYRDQDVLATGKVARDKGVNIVPLSFNVQRFSMLEEGIGTAYLEEYDARFPAKYGEYIWDTGYEFNADKKNIMDGSKFKSAPDVCSRLLTNLDVTSPYRPAVFLNSGLKYILFGANPNATKELYTPPVPSAAVLEYYDDRFKTYDTTQRVQMHGADGKCLDGVGVLLFYDGYAEAPGRMGVSDDNSVMYMGNNDLPCWILDAGRVYNDVPEIPLFRRGMYHVAEVAPFDGYRCTLDITQDFVPPQEMDAPGISFNYATGVMNSGWTYFLRERYSQSTKVMTVYLTLDLIPPYSGELAGYEPDLVGMGLAPVTLLFRRCIRIDDSLWALNRIIDYNINGNGLTKCEFVKIHERNYYYF